MTTFDFQWHSFPMEQDAKLFLEKYLKRIETYARKHTIDLDVVEDIYQSILDKLFAMKKPITQKNLIALVNDLWEPEDIFAGNEMLNLPDTDEEKGWWLFTIRSWCINFFKGIWRCIAGICIGVWKLVKRICIGLRISLRRFCRYWWKGLKGFFVYLRLFLQWVRKFLFRFLFFFILAGICFCVFISSLVALTCSLGLKEYVFNNINFFETLPISIKIWLAFWVIAFCIFTLATAKFACTGKSIKYAMLVGIPSFVLMMFFGLIGAFQLFKIYGHTSTFATETNFALWANKEIVLDMSDLIAEGTFPFQGLDSLRLENSAGTTLKLVFEYKVFWNGELQAKFEKAIIQPTLVEKSWILELENFTNFTEIVPFIPFMRSAVLYVPEGYRLRLVGNYYPWGHNATTFPLEEKYREVADNRGHFGCEDRVVWYSKEEKRFVCAVDGYELENLKRRYMQEYVLKHFDEFSPITHKEEYKRNYRWYNWTQSDWNFREISWEERNGEVRLYLNFSDQSVEIQAKLKVVETESGALVEEFEIEKVWVIDEGFDEEYYERIDESVRKFLEVGDGEEEVEDNEGTISTWL